MAPAPRPLRFARCCCHLPQCAMRFSIYIRAVCAVVCAWQLLDGLLQRVKGVRVAALSNGRTPPTAPEHVVCQQASACHPGVNSGAGRCVAQACESGQAPGRVWLGGWAAGGAAGGELGGRLGGGPARTCVSTWCVSPKHPRAAPAWIRALAGVWHRHVWVHGRWGIRG